MFHKASAEGGQYHRIANLLHGCLHHSGGQSRKEWEASDGHKGGQGVTGNITFVPLGKLTSQIPSVSACSSVKHLKKVVGDSARIQRVSVYPETMNLNISH